MIATNRLRFLRAHFNRLEKGALSLKLSKDKRGRSKYISFRGVSSACISPMFSIKEAVKEHKRTYVLKLRIEKYIFENTLHLAPS